MERIGLKYMWIHWQLTEHHCTCVGWPLYQAMKVKQEGTFMNSDTWREERIRADRMFL